MAISTRQFPSRIIRLLENPHSQTEFAWGCRPSPARFAPAQTPSAEQRNLLVARLDAANAFGSRSGPQRDSPLRAAALGFAVALGRTAGQRSAHARAQVRLGDRSAKPGAQRSVCLAGQRGTDRRSR